MSDWSMSRVKWSIGGLLFTATMINYIDRQTLSVLAPFLKIEYHWRNQDFALIVIAFRLAYAVGQALSGRFLDRVGTRTGMTIAVAWYSVVAALTSLASGLRSFIVFRFLLGAGESANWPGAAKAVAEWFPQRERAFAVALFESGSSIGGALAPWLVIAIYQRFGGWRPAFLLTGLLGLIWVVAWRRFYYSPEQHPNLGRRYKEMTLDGDARENERNYSRSTARWSQLLVLPQTWGVILGRALIEPVWFFVADWLAIILVSKGIKIEGSMAAFSIPFVAADMGSLFGGALSGWLIARGWSVGSARKIPMIVFSFGMTALIPIGYVSNVWAVTALFAIATFSYAVWITMNIVLPSDLFPSDSVATVTGMSGTGGGVATVLSTCLIGYVSDRYSFKSLLSVAGICPLIATGVSLLLLRNRIDNAAMVQRT